MTAQGSGATFGNRSPELEHPDDLAHREFVRTILKDSRVARGFAATAWAKESGVPKEVILKMENPRYPSYYWRINQIQRWAMTLNMRFNIEFAGIEEIGQATQDLHASDPYWFDMFSSLRFSPMSVGAIGIGILRKVVDLRGMEVTQVCKAMGITPGSYFRIEKSISPRVSTIQRFTRALGGQAFLRPRLWNPKHLEAADRAFR